MRLDTKIILKIHNEMVANGINNIEIGSSKDGLSLRFGYWKEIKRELVEKINDILPKHLYIVSQLVDDDPECGELYDYGIIKKN